MATRKKAGKRLVSRGRTAKCKQAQDPMLERIDQLEHKLQAAIDAMGRENAQLSKANDWLRNVIVRQGQRIQELQEEVYASQKQRNQLRDAKLCLAAKREVAEEHFRMALVATACPMEFAARKK